MDFRELINVAKQNALEQQNGTKTVSKKQYRGNVRWASKAKGGPRHMISWAEGEFGKFLEQSHHTKRLTRFSSLLWFPFHAAGANNKRTAYFRGHFAAEMIEMK